MGVQDCSNASWEPYVRPVMVAASAYVHLAQNYITCKNCQRGKRTPKQGQPATRTVGQSGAELRLMDPNQMMCHVMEVTGAAVPAMPSDPHHSDQMHCQQAVQTLQAKLPSIKILIT